MRRLTGACAVVLLVSINSIGQDIPKTEIFVAYSYLRGKGTAVPTRADENTNMSGWNISAVRNFNSWFALVTDFSGHYGNHQTRSVLPSAGDFKTSTTKNLHLFLVGPRFSLNKSNRLTPFVHTLFGVVRASTRAEERLAPFPPFKVSNTDVGFAAAFGAGVDLKVNRRLAVRLIQADYVLTRLEKTTVQIENKENLRVSSGVSIRF